MPTVTRDGVCLYFEELGEGTPVLFHTGGGGDGEMWKLAGYTDSLDAFCRILMDHRGHGRSDCPTQPAQHGFDEYVDDVVAVLDAARAERAVFVGYSGGASVGYGVAAAHPDRLLALVAIGNVPGPAEEGASNRDFSAHVRRIGMRAAMEEMGAREEESPPKWLIDNLATTDPEMFALLLDAWSDAGDAWDDLPKITAPTLLVCGEREHSNDEMQAALTRLPDGRGVRLPGYGHLQAFWHGEVTAPLIVDFLRERVGGI